MVDYIKSLFGCYSTSHKLEYINAFSIRAQAIVARKTDVQAHVYQRLMYQLIECAHKPRSQCPYSQSHLRDLADEIAPGFGNTYTAIYVAQAVSAHYDYRIGEPRRLVTET